MDGACAVDPHVYVDPYRILTSFSYLHSYCRSVDMIVFMYEETTDFRFYPHESLCARMRTSLRAAVTQCFAATLNLRQSPTHSRSFPKVSPSLAENIHPLAKRRGLHRTAQTSRLHRIEIVAVSHNFDPSRILLSTWCD